MKLEASWKQALAEEFKLPYLKNLRKFLESENAKGKVIFPPSCQIFQAFNLCPYSKVKVVILGQDPYHGINQAHGLAFSVNKNVAIPPSLQNIYKELSSDIKIPIPNHGDLSHWARQGVLLLNNVLTVEQAKAASHQKKGWEQFTKKVISLLALEKKNLVFILWGKAALEKAKEIDTRKHLIISSAHPSPLSVYRGFFGHRPFSQTNEYLVKNNISPIQW